MKAKRLVQKDFGTGSYPARKNRFPVVKRGDEIVGKALPLSQLTSSHSPIRASSGGVGMKAWTSLAAYVEEELFLVSQRPQVSPAGSSDWVDTLLN